LRRRVSALQLAEAAGVKWPAFLKPADPLNKCFDAGVYRSVGDIRGIERVNGNTLLLSSEPVEWTIEYRVFVVDESVIASSPYIQFGRTAWRPWRKGDSRDVLPTPAQELCRAAIKEGGSQLPPAYVLDVGLIDKVGWGIVEFNPLWSSGILGADPNRVV